MEVLCSAFPGSGLGHTFKQDEWHNVNTESIIGDTLSLLVHADKHAKLIQSRHLQHLQPIFFPSGRPKVYNIQFHLQTQHTPPRTHRILTSLTLHKTRSDPKTPSAPPPPSSSPSSSQSSPPLARTVFHPTPPPHPTPSLQNRPRRPFCLRTRTRNAPSPSETSANGRPDAPRSSQQSGATHSVSLPLGPWVTGGTWGGGLGGAPWG